MIALNGRATVRDQVGGVERYGREVSARLLAIAPERYRMLSPSPRFAHGAGHLWEQGVLPWRARHDTLIYSPANLAPLRGPGNVVVIHDTAVYSQPSAYSRAYVAYQRAMLPAIARRAELVITVSEFSRGEIIEHLGVTPPRVVVVAPGVERRFNPSADAAAAARELGCAARPYVLAVGTSSARKNHGALSAVASALAGQGIDVVLAGSGRGYLRSSDLASDAGANAHTHTDPDGIRRLGYVEERLLPGLYAGALALVMPSLYEGFGLPCIEAMASGVPVIAADAGALPETCGGAALLVDPADGAAMGGAVVSVVDDGELRRRLVAAGLTRAGQFTWDAAARATDAAILKLLSADGPRV